MNAAYENEKDTTFLYHFHSPKAMKTMKRVYFFGCIKKGGKCKYLQIGFSQFSSRVFPRTQSKYCTQMF